MAPPLKKIINHQEEAAYRELQKLAADYGYSVHIKIRLADVISIEGTGISDALYSFALKCHFDFIVCNENHDPLFAVEFDGPSHQEAEQRARDSKKNEICERFGLPLLRINTRHLIEKYNKASLLRWIISARELQKAFDEAQAKGQIPADEDFDPIFLWHPGETIEEVHPHWVSLKPRRAALRTIVRRDDGRTYREMLTQMAKESGIDTPTADDLVRIDRNRKGKKLSNAEWTSKTDPAAKIAKLKDGRTHLAYKPEHAVDLDTGIIVAAALHPADQGDTTTIEGTLRTAARNLAQVSAAPTTDKPSELVADKGYHSRALLKTLAGGAWNTRIAEPKQWGFSRWHGDDKARAAVYANRTRLGSAVGKQAMRRRAEIVERSFAHNLDRGGMRRTWLRGRENVHKRYLVHVAGHNLGILMRLLIGAGTPKEAAGRPLAYLLFVYTDEAVTIILVAASPDRSAILVLAVTAYPG